jgi:Zn-dependent protease with chaperone function/3-phenylpropionate/cinnamic acid dioxygenase small subunit
MEQAEYEQMVARLERESVAAPTAYQLKVAALALLGFAILAVVVGFAGLGLVLLAGIAIATVLTGGKALILLFKLGKLLLLLAIPLWMLVKSSLSALFTRLPAPQGLALKRAQAPALFAAIDDMRRRMKGPRFHHVLVTDDLNAAVVQRPLFGLAGWPRNYLILGLPLLDALTPQEALAVVAHEYGHLAGSHSRFAAYIYRLRHTWGTIQQISQQWSGWTGRPLQRLVGWYAPYFNAYTFVLARANEYQADAASAELVGAGVAASALKRVDISAARYQAYVDQTFGAMRDAPAPPQDFASRWAQRASEAAPPDDAQRWLASALERASQVHDTHPVLRERLRALPGQGRLLQELPAPLAGPSAATAWLGAHAATLRETLQRQWQERVASPWKERHEELQQRVQRLAELETKSDPTLDEQIERLRLRVELRPEDDQLDALVAFNAEHADQALTLFLEASLRLQRDDETGLALLERTIALDADAIKPAAEKAYAFLNARRDEAAAKVWADRWNERQAFELGRAQQLQQLDPGHALRAAELTDAQRARVKTLLGRAGTGVQRAWLARRVLPADPSIETHVLGLELTRWARFRSKGPEIVERLSAHEWPLHLFICVLDGRYEPLRGKFEQIPGSEMPIG